ncbi:MAG: hypothetical protein Q9169_002702 [Polycauliona sp. 2 TL-2023]
MITDYFRGTGTLGVSPLILISSIPPIITEWSALIPLASHLASQDDGHHLVGELALAGFLNVGLFPRLGHLLDVSKLLKGVPEYFDRVNARSESSQKVWDVNWGSVFTRANGAAVSIITDHILSGPRKIICMPEEVLAEPGLLPGGSTTAHAAPGEGPLVNVRPVFSRPQKLHVIRLSRTSRSHANSHSSLKYRLLSRVWRSAYYVSLVCLIGVICLYGAFGSAAMVLNGLLAKLVCRHLRTERPPGYLENNENHEACMLTAVHENASTWYLYVGDRGVVDWMLNKTMLATPSATGMHTIYFRVAHVVQLLGMTFVAAQKGMDGITLVILLVVYYTITHFHGSRRAAKAWLDAESVSFDAHTFQFSGRTPMVGAVYMISEARDAGWTETLLVSCPRRNVWLDELKCVAHMRRQLGQAMQNLSPSDRSWVLLNTQLAVEASRIIRGELDRGKTTESG